jgi:hypothetical protein
MKSLVIIGIIVVLFFVVDTIEPVFGILSYPSNGQRLYDLPIYCIVEPSGYTASERGKYVNLAVKGVSEWDTKLQGYETINPSIWKIKSKIISSAADTSNCSIVMNFKNTVEQISGTGNTVGVFYHGTDSIDVATKNLSLAKIYNIILHEIGHSIGLGHYKSDDDDENKKWYSGKEYAPSIMIPTTHNNPSLMTIMGTDLNKVRAIYGSEGFYAFSSKSSPFVPTPTPVPIIPIKPIIPINPFESIAISNELIVVKKYASNYVKIIGQIDDDVYQKGHPLFIIVKKPDNSFDTHKIQSTSTGYFELPLVFDDKSKKGWYTVEASYLEHSDRTMNFNFNVVSEFSQNPLPKTKNFSFPEPKTFGNTKYGKYFDDISIKVNGDKYTVTTKLNTNLPSKQIRITAENECPFKKQVYEKDFRSSMGAKTSFSFYQLSHGKPTNCSIHFTITDFEGRLLDSTKADYNSQTKKQITSNTTTKTTKFVSEKITNPIFSIDQKQKLTKKIDSASVSILKLKDGLNVSKNSLYDADKKYTNSESKNHVEKAWQVYNKLNDKRINSMNALNAIVETYLNLENKQKTSNWNHYNQYTNHLKTINSEITSIGNDMKYISQELDYAEKAQNEEKSKPAKQCSWFWC